MDETLTRQTLMDQFQSVRSQTEALCAPLIVEDHLIQSMPDVSPPKWHLAHTTWFFETFILLKHLENYSAYDKSFTYLFNSYYNGVGKQFPRDLRGVLSRPSVAEVYAYRKHVNNAMKNLLANTSSVNHLVELGLHHEQQHQELLLMDVKHNFFMHPDFPVYQTYENSPTTETTNLKFISLNGGLISIGHNDENFSYDNELPHHQTFLHPYKIANRLTTNGEYLEFITAGGYKNPQWWLVDGWMTMQNQHWVAPLYWQYIDNTWYEFTLSGLKKLNLAEPVTHLSYYEANAYAQWRNMRLPTEQEWEHFVLSENIPMHKGNFVEKNILHPESATNNHTQAFGDAWEWTSSDYHPYPGFKPLRGVIGEYNGKFMHNQKVLRGGSCITPRTHIRASYRNFFAADKRWPFTGVRLASDL